MECFGCQKSTKATRKVRALCVARGSHRPVGPVIEHEHRSEAVRECADCQTLVVV